MNHLRDYSEDHEFVKQYLINNLQSELTQLANRELKHLYVELADVQSFNEELASRIVENTNRYVQIFYDVLDELLPTRVTRELFKDPLDVFIERRLCTQRVGEYPPELIRRAELSFRHKNLKFIPIRDVKAETVGKLATIRGIVTRATDVKPKITIATYTCDRCSCETFQPVKGTDFTPLFECSSPACTADKTLGRLTMQTRGSKFVKFQEIKLQEHSDQVPTGHIPRTITVMSHGELTRLCTPGDHISVTGVFLPVEKSSFRMRTGGLTADTFIEAHYLVLMTKTDDDELCVEAMSMEEAGELAQDTTDFFGKLSSSIAPEIWGHEDLKKALFLLLVGGVDRSPHGMKVRGNINICLMGDPGVAKSQLLSFIDRLAQRSQYTTGRGSSGVGLTAAVLKDPITNELVLEGGALVLADQGICCIDEFDKMMDADRTAIHEVMEQQTVSIAKAGIMTTLNARVSILAAANPAYGRYNVHRSITDNLQLPPALLSRFDLLWLIRDTPNTHKDLDLAEHITRIHSHPEEAVPCNHDAIDMKTMRRYISLCKTKNPTIPLDLTERLIKIYLDIRVKKRTSTDGDALFTSPRSLLAILRLSTALARLRLADEVTGRDVEEALRLHTCSRESIEGASSEAGSVDFETIKILKEMAKQSRSRKLSLDDVYEFAKKEQKIFNEHILRFSLERLHTRECIEVSDGSVLLIDIAPPS